jgi:hypothetical protein
MLSGNSTRNQTFFPQPESPRDSWRLMSVKSGPVTLLSVVAATLQKTAALMGIGFYQVC